MESHENIKSIAFQSHLSKLDQKKFFYCYTSLDDGCSAKEAIDSFFRRAL